MLATAPMPPGVPKCVTRWSLAIALLLWLAARGRAEDAFEAPPDCGTRGELEQGIAELAPDATRARPDVRITAEGDGYVLEVLLPDGPRALRDRDCHALFRAAMLIAALGAEAVLGAHTPDSSPAPAPPSPSSSSASSSMSSLSRPSPSRPRETHLDGLLAAGVAHGIVPDYTLAIAAGLSAARSWLGGRLLFSYQLPRSHHDGAEGVRAGALGVSGTLDVLPARWLRLGLGGDFYLMHARGLDVSSARSDWATLATLHAALGLRLFGQKRWALEAQARGLYAPQPARFMIRGRPPVYTTASFGFQLGLGFSWRFL